MPDLILRPTTNEPSKAGTPWALQLRYHDGPGETDYITITRVSVEMAREIIKAGAATWLLGEPKEPPP